MNQLRQPGRRRDRASRKDAKRSRRPSHDRAKPPCPCASVSATFDHFAHPNHCEQPHGCAAIHRCKLDCFVSLATTKKGHNPHPRPLPQAREEDLRRIFLQPGEARQPEWLLPASISRAPALTSGRSGKSWPLSRVRPQTNLPFKSLIMVGKTFRYESDTL